MGLIGSEGWVGGYGRKSRGFVVRTMMLEDLEMPSPEYNLVRMPRAMSADMFK